jgi:thiol-disulfide isomerase/thioredoxin
MIKVKKRHVIPLWDQKRFDKAIKQSPRAVVVVYNFLCPACKLYLKSLNYSAGEWKEDPGPLGSIKFYKIHMHLEWVNDKAELERPMDEENKFLFDEYGFGKGFPVTAFFRDGELVHQVDDRLNDRVMLENIEKAFELSLVV